MSWIKDTILDLIVLLTIISLIFFKSNTIIIALWAYTCLLLVGKVLALFMPSLKRRSDKTSTPEWFYHIIYVSSIAILLYLQEYYLCGAWFIVWILSIISSNKTTKK